MNKKNLGVLVGLVVVILVGIYLVVSHSSSQVLGAVPGSVHTVVEGYPNGITQGPRGTFDNWYGDKIGAKTNTAVFKNTTPYPLYVDYVQVSTDNFASSTYKVFAFATTSAVRTLYDTVAPVNAASTTIMINGFKFATSSAATTTTSSKQSFGDSTVLLPINSSLIIQVVNADTGCTSSNGFCESATSTNRGFNLQWRIHVHD